MFVPRSSEALIVYCRWSVQGGVERALDPRACRGRVRSTRSSTSLYDTTIRYSGLEIRATPARTEVIIHATRTAKVLGENGRRILELTFLVQKRFGFADGTIDVRGAECCSSSLTCCSSMLSASPTVVSRP